MTIIRVDKIYNNVELFPEFITGKEADTVLRRIKEEPDYMRIRVQKEDKLDSRGKITWKLNEEGDFGKTKENKKIDAQIKVIYVSPPKPAISTFRLIVLILGAYLILSGIISVAFVQSLETNTEFKNKCYLYKFDGRPVRLLFGNEMYWFERDGQMPEIVKLTWNQQMKHVLDEPEKYCVVISNDTGM